MSIPRPFAGLALFILGCGGHTALSADAEAVDTGIDARPAALPLVGFYDGRPATGGPYQIGRADSVDGQFWTRSNSVPILTPTGTGWERDLVKDAYVVAKGSTEYLYYSGYNTTTQIFQIGLAISSDGGKTFQRTGSSPVLPAGAAGSNDDGGVTFPIVRYEPEAPADEQWKMWYTARTAANHVTIAYAHSADGMTWQKVGSMLDLGAAGAFDSTLVKTGGVYKIGTEYSMLYGGNIDIAGRGRWSVGLATFTDPERPYAKQGQILAPMVDRVQNLTQDAATGTTSVDVGNPKTFRVGESVYVAQRDSLPRLTRIASVVSPGVVTLRDPLANGLTTANSAAVRSVYSWSITPRNAWFLDGHWVMSITVLQQFSDLVSNYLTEMSATAVSAGDSLSGPWQVDLARGVLLEPAPGSSDWDTGSADNLMVLQP